MRELVRLAWPIAVSMLSYSVMTLVDTLFVGRLGPAALAGTGLGGTAAFALLCFAFGLLRGEKVLVSQAAGAGRSDETSSVLGAGLWMAGMLGVAIVILARPCASLLPVIASTAAAGDNARAYLEVRSLGAPVVLVYAALREYRYGLGDSRSPMWAMVAANVTNVVLDWILIFPCGLGVAGAAWASVAAHGVEAAVLIAVQRRAGFGLRMVAPRHVRALWRIGAPTGLQFLLEMGSFMLLAVLLAALSELDMAAHQIAIQVIHFTFLPALAVGEAASVMIGQAVGANRDSLVRRVARRAMALCGGYAAACTLVLVFGSAWIVSGFTDDAALRSAAIPLLWVAAVFQIFDAGNIVARCALRGAGDVAVPAVVGIVLSWALTPPATWLLGYMAGLGALGAWMGLCAEIVLGAAYFWWRLERRGWRKAARQSRRRLGVARGRVAVAGA